MSSMENDQLLNTEMGLGEEFDAIRRLLAVWGSTAKGIGDDAAVVDSPVGERLLLSTDACIEDVHFRAGWISPAEIGQRAACAALSDLAAMGAIARYLLVSMEIPFHWRSSIEEIGRGIGRIATSAGALIIGGNMSAGSKLALNISVVGTAFRPVSRAGAKVGDRLYVTGALGGPAKAVRAFESGDMPLPLDRSRFVCPLPRLEEARWLAENGATAMMDISDGLISDAGHMSSASAVFCSIDSSLVPMVPGASLTDALEGGEEYELLVATSEPFDCNKFQALFGIELSFIGTVMESSSGNSLSRGGHDHFAI